MNSCEDNPPMYCNGKIKYIWVEFRHYHGYALFMKIIFKNVDCDSDLYKRSHGFVM